MSSLTKQLLFFLVFSIVCNLTTSDCIKNLQEVFNESNESQNSFKIALAALSENLLQSFYTSSKSVNAQNLCSYYQSQTDVTYGLVHEEVLTYFNCQSFLNNEGSSSSIEEFSILEQADLLGYFQSFAERIEENASTIDNIMLSPVYFCNSPTGYDKFMCYQALGRMLKLPEFDPMTELNVLMAKTGSFALKYCFLNYTYLDFIKNSFFPQWNDNRYAHPSIYLEETLIRDTQKSIMVEYFNYLLDVSTKIGNTNRKTTTKKKSSMEVGSSASNPRGSFHFPLTNIPNVPKIFLTIEEYCLGTEEN